MKTPLSLIFFRSSCAILDDENILITGGYHNKTRKKVTKYNHNGVVEDLPDLIQGRWLHGCSFYMRNKTKVFIRAILVWDDVNVIVLYYRCIW